MIGRTLSHYEILDEISRGGMGVVYRALDLKLNREVAVKVLAPDLVSDPERKRRFVREARAAAALSHPNIAVIHEIDETDEDETTFIAMELIEGEKLSDVLARERLPLARVLEIATELLEAIAKAHDRGIIHRDIKPANVMITGDGHPKLIDFGLAKLVEPLGEEGSETPTRDETRAGVVLGTYSYMSPEQARGDRVDHRTDIFSFGILLYEMSSGRRPFQAPTMPETLAAIINTPPPPLTRFVTGGASSELGRIVDRCLSKNPEDRYRTAEDLLSDLRLVKRRFDEGKSLTPAQEERRSRLWWFWMAGLLALIGVSAYLALGRVTDRREVPRLANPVQVTSAVGVEEYPSWSPDGQTIAYHSNRSFDADIWIAQVGSGQHLNRTEASDLFEVLPSWSPDGREIAFASLAGEPGIYVMSPLSGAPRKLVDAERPWRPSWPQWSADGSELAYLLLGTSLLERTVLRTGETHRTPLPGRWSRRADLAWSPDGRLVAYVDTQSYRSQITQLWIVNLESGEGAPVTEGGFSERSPSWSADGRALYYVSNRGGSMDLWQQNLTRDALPEGPPQPVTTGIGMRAARFSPDGKRLAYSKGQWMANLWRVPILADRMATWDDAEQLTFDQAFVEFLDISPDGTQIVFSSDRAGNPDLWLMPVDGGEMTQLTTDPTPDWFPSWSPDGDQIAFYSYRSGSRHIWTMPSEGGTARQLTSGDSEDYHPVWSPDGQQIAFFSGRSGNLDVWAVPSEGGEARQVTDDPADDSYVRWSPDGGWLLVVSVRSGRPGLWLVPNSGEAPVPLTQGPSGFPVFSRDGDTIFFLGVQHRGGNLWAVSIDGGVERPVTDFDPRHGGLGVEALATDGEYLYFTWEEDLGDIWVMDVVDRERE